MSFISYLVNGISLGSVYAIIALGYTMVYGIAKMLNFAHGDVIMIGGYVVFVTVSGMALGIDSFAHQGALDKNGRTILWRRFNRNDWAYDRYGKLWSEQLPENEQLSINGQIYVQWYDCITDYIL